MKEENKTEIYKDILGYEGLYQISNFGNVKSLKWNKEKILKKSITHKGYFLVNLHKNNKIVAKSVHRLVALTFIENTNNKPQVNHINGIKTDNRAINLEWCTASENIKHAYKNGLNISIKGEKNTQSKLTTEQVILIKKDNRTQLEIAKDYNVDRSLIGYIKQGKKWKHII